MYKYCLKVFKYYHPLKVYFFAVLTQEYKFLELFNNNNVCPDSNNPTQLYDL